MLLKRQKFKVSFKCLQTTILKAVTAELSRFLRVGNYPFVNG